MSNEKTELSAQPHPVIAGALTASEAKKEAEFYTKKGYNELKSSQIVEIPFDVNTEVTCESTGQYRTINGKFATGDRIGQNWFNVMSHVKVTAKDSGQSHYCFIMNYYDPSTTFDGKVISYEKTREGKTTIRKTIAV